MSTIQDGLLTAAPRQRSVGFSQAAPAVFYSGQGNGYSRTGYYDPGAAVRQVAQNAAWAPRYIGAQYGYNPYATGLFVRAPYQGGKKTRRRKSKSRKTRRSAHRR